MIRAEIEVNAGGRVVRRTVRARSRAHALEQARAIAELESGRSVGFGACVLDHLRREDGDR